MFNIVLKKILTILENEASSFNHINNGLKYNLHCIYCGRSKHNKPHLNVFVKINNDHITGSVYCFRCGTSKSLLSFLKEIQLLKGISYLNNEELQKFVKITKCNSNDISINCNISNFFNFSNFFNSIYDKGKSFLYLSAFYFIKNKLKLNCAFDTKNAIYYSQFLKYKPFINNNNLWINFNNFIYYIFPLSSDKTIMKLYDPLDKIIHGDYLIVQFDYKNYKKIYQKGQSINKVIFFDGDTCNFVDTLNIFIAEGIFDIYTIFLYKYKFDFTQLDLLKSLVKNIYIPNGNSSLDSGMFKFITFFTKEYHSFLETLNLKNISNLNMIFVADTNRNGFKYIHKLLNRLKLSKEFLKFLEKFNCSYYYVSINNQNINDINDAILHPEFVGLKKVYIL